jgi:6-bladed beta-propeller
MRKTGISLVLMIGLFSLYASGTAEEKIVNRLPKYGQIQLDLQENVIIKEIDGDSNYQFGNGLWDLAVDKNGNLYILDYDRLLKYDSSGKFLETIGKKGEGPGEFLQPRRLFADEKGDIYVSDRYRFLHLFGSDGKFVKKIALEFTISFNANSFSIDRSGFIYAAMMDVSESGPKTTLVKADPNGKILKKFEVVRDRNVQIQGSSRGGVMSGMVHEYSERLCFNRVGQSLLCSGTNTSYELSLFDLERGLRTTFSKDAEAIQITAEEKKTLGPSAVFPSYRPFFSDILSDEEGRIYIVRTKSLLDKTSKTEIDIFSSDGHYLYGTVVPFKPRAFLKGSLYSIEQDDHQMRMIKKWTIRNFRELKVD